MASERLEQAVEFAENPEPRCAVVLLLDTSGSMNGQPIIELNEGLKELDRVLKADSVASKRVEVAIVTFGGVVQAIDPKSGGRPLSIPFDAEQAFITVDDFRPPALEANGETPMGEAVRQALMLIRLRKDLYKRNGIEYYRPWIVLITDGEPTDAGWEASADEVKREEAGKHVVFYPIGVQRANMQTLARFSDQRQPLKLQGLAFQELFNWLSKSLSAVSQSRPGEQVPLPPVGWAQVDA